MKNSIVYRVFLYAFNLIKNYSSGSFFVSVFSRSGALLKKYIDESIVKRTFSQGFELGKDSWFFGLISFFVSILGKIADYIHRIMIKSKYSLTYKLIDNIKITTHFMFLFITSLTLVIIKLMTSDTSELMLLAVVCVVSIIGAILGDVRVKENSIIMKTVVRYIPFYKEGNV